MISPFDYLILGVIGFIVIRVLWWVLVQIPQNHAKDEAICEKCMGKLMEDEVTKPLNWCECPEREEEFDEHV